MSPPLPAILDLVDGRFVAPSLRLGPPISSPNDGGELYAHVASDADAVEAALAAAARADAEGRLSSLSGEERARLLERVAAEIEGLTDALARYEAETTGVVITLCRQLAAIVPHTFRSAAALLRAEPAMRTLAGRHGDVEVHRLPRGPAVVISPWNAPVPIAAHKAASALAAGCPVILKPSDLAPHGCGVVAQAIAAAGLPAGSFQLLHGGAEVGRALVTDPRVQAVSFTGGLAGGRAVAAACAHEMKPVQLELGGNNPLVVLDDADLDAAADGVVTALTQLNGQWCRGLGRLLVARTVEAPLFERVRDRLARLRLGDSRDPASQMGPLVHESHRARIAAAVDDLFARGARLHAPTPRPALRGCFYPPTLVTGVEPQAATAEIFGPVATVHTFDSDEEAVTLANASPFGLAGYVYARRADRALACARRIRAGVLKVNGVTLLGLHPDAPRPAWGLSGLVDEGVRETFEFFRGTRVIGVAGGANA